MRVAIDFRRALALAVALVTVGVILYWLDAAHSDAAAAQLLAGASETPAAVEVGANAPDFAYSTLDGRRLRLSDLRGSAVVLNFWASWCRPCEMEMTDMQRLQDIFPDTQLVVLGLNVGESGTEVAGFTNHVGVAYRIGLDPDLTVANAYHAMGLPTTVLIDAQGLIREIHLGQLSFADLKELVEEKVPILRGHSRSVAP